MESFVELPKNFENPKLNKKWLELMKIRDICNLSIEEKRASKEIGSSLEAALTIEINEKQNQILENIDLSELCITSSVDVKITNREEIIVKTNKAEGAKCPICWKINVKPCPRHG